MKLTPGPWKVKSRQTYFSVTNGTSNPKWDIARCWRVEDAKLIAAIPDLYEALKELVDLVEAAREGEYEIDSLTCQPARTALAKVEE